MRKQIIYKDHSPPPPPPHQLIPLTTLPLLKSGGEPGTFNLLSTSRQACPVLLT